MEKNHEYHDPDYPEASTSSRQTAPTLTEEEKVEKIKQIVRREFENELCDKENELYLIDQRVLRARLMLHRLRYTLVSSFYQDRKLQLTPTHIQEELTMQHEPRAKTMVSAILRNDQKRIHPSIKKLLGSDQVNLEEIFKIRAPRNKVRTDYKAMVQSKNYTVPADGNLKSLRPDIKPEPLEVVSKRLSTDDPGSIKPKKMPRHLEPKLDKPVVTFDEVTRNKQKHRYRIIIGNTSKYAPPASAVDRSTHKWLLYVRGPPARPDLSRVLSALTVTLHETYAPHHRVHIDKPPFHISRRGWGEFPAKVELHFAQPLMNRPATLEHTIKLDRNYTGLQTLGAETIVDVWLYSNEEMLEFEYKEEEAAAPPAAPPVVKEEPAEVKAEPLDMDSGTDSNWMDFFSTETTELDVDEMIIKPIKKEPERKSIEEGVQEINVKEEVGWCPEDDRPNVEDDIEKTCMETNCDLWTESLLTNPKTDLPNEILKQSPPKKRIMKYMDPTTGKIYYLEMDRNLDISKVQEIIINSKGNKKTAKISPVKPSINGIRNVKRTSKKGVSLLKPEVKSLLNNNTKSVLKTRNNYAHIENDHCYISTPKHLLMDSKENALRAGIPSLTDACVASCENSVVLTAESVYEQLCGAVGRLHCVRTAVNYLLSKIPLISDSDNEYFPFTVASEDRYWNLDIIKRRSIEWSRAKFINTILSKHFQHGPIWRTKQVLLFGRLHGYQPAKAEPEAAEWSSWRDLEGRARLHSDLDPQDPGELATLTVFDDAPYAGESRLAAVDLTGDADVDVEGEGAAPAGRGAGPGGRGAAPGAGPALPGGGADERLRFLYVERRCAEIGIEIRNEDVGNGYTYSAVHAVMLCAVKRFAEELIRTSLAEQQMEARRNDSGLPMPVWTEGPRRAELRHVARAARRPPARAPAARGLAAPRPPPRAPL